jgi:cob(I)alamin adenosyltransferase
MISLEKARRAAEAATKKAEELKQNITVVIVDAAGNRVLVNKMEGAFPVSDSIAFTKAFTSATLWMASGDMAPYAEPGKPYYGLESIMGGSFTTIAGGVPVKDADGKVIGAVGVGGSYDTAQDATCALAAVEVLSK